jgi:hypothetical protein
MSLVTAAILVLVSAPTAARATCVVAIVSDDAIVLGADGLEKYYNGTTQKVCKISSGPDWAFTMSGLVRHEGSGFNLVELARQCLRMALPRERQIVSFEQTATAAIQSEIDQERLKNPAALTIHDGHIISTAIFAMRDQASLLLIICEFRLEAGQVTVLPTRRVQSLGDRQAIALCRCVSALQRMTPEFRGLDSVSIARRMIRFDIDTSKGSDGDPIALARIGVDGVVWVQPGLCGAGH